MTRLPPRVVTWDDLLRVLFPIVRAYPWAMDELRDLWLLGAPTPDSGPGVPEKRILLPHQFEQWWEHITRRMGMDLGLRPLWDRLGRH